MEAFRKLGVREVYYSGISVLEALRKMVKAVKGEKGEVERIRKGVRAIRGTLGHAPVDDEAVVNAMAMHRLRRRDVVGNLLYSIAISQGLEPPAVGRELVEFERNTACRGTASSRPRSLQN